MVPELLGSQNQIVVDCYGLNMVKCLELRVILLGDGRIFRRKVFSEIFFIFSQMALSHLWRFEISALPFPFWFPYHEVASFLC